MFKQITAVALTALALGACSMETASSEDLGTQEAALTGAQCGVTGLEWKTFVAHLAYDAAEDFGRWEFTTDLYVNGDRLAISGDGWNRCISRGRPGCPSVTAGLSAQEGSQPVISGGKVILDPAKVRKALVEGLQAQYGYEAVQGTITDPTASAPYNTFQSPTRTGLQHTLTLTNCAVTAYSDFYYNGKSQCLRTGSMRMSDLVAGIGDNIMSSLRVRPGMKVVLYEHDQFSGASTVLTGDHSAMMSYFNDRVSSLTVSDTTGACSARDSYKVNLTNGGDWTKIRGKLQTLGYMRGNDVLDVRIDLANQIIEVDPFNVDFVPPSQIGGTTYGVSVKSDVAETWRSTEDPAPSIFPVGAACKKKNHNGTTWLNGVVKSMGSYRYCYT
jgi:hypothetical protein